MAQTKKKTPRRKAANPRVNEPAASNTKRRTAKKTARPTPRLVPEKGITKTAAALTLLKQKNGATLAELMTTTGWQAHSVRGFLSGTVRKRMALTLESKSTDAGRRYWIEPGSGAKRAS